MPQDPWRTGRDPLRGRKLGADVDKRDLYEVLGVPRDADAAALKKAYRRLAVRYHPDRCDEPDAEVRFREATDAYSILCDPEKRRRYDLGGHAAVEGRGGFDPSQFSDFGDLFGAFREMFGMDFGDAGGGRSSPRPTRGSDLLYELGIEFEEAALGTRKDLEIPRLDTCSDCQGSGAAPGTGRTTCPDCLGRGQIVMRQGFFAMSRPCSRCRTTGDVVETPCDECGGAGRVEVRRRLKVRIPAGIAGGQRIRLAGEGEAGEHGGPPGDLYVAVSVAEHDILHREGADLHVTLRVGFAQVALGTEVEVPLLGDDSVEVEVPAGTESGEVLRLKGHGVRKLGASGHGDLFVHVQVKTPRHLTAKQKKLLREYAASVDEGYEIGEDKSFLERVKELFA